MPALLHRLFNYSARPAQLRIPLLLLVVALLFSGYGLFSSEQFFSQLDTSRSAVSISELLAELQSLNTELRNFDAFERTLILTGDQAIAENFNEACKLLSEHVSRLRGSKTLNPTSQNRLKDILSKIDQKVVLGRKIANERIASGMGAIGNDLNAERGLNIAITLPLGALIGEQTRLKDDSTATMDNARFTTQFLILAFRTALAVFLVICLLLATRYFTEKRTMEALLKGAETKFRAVLDQTFQFSGVLSPQGELLDFNRTLLGFSEVDAKEVLHKPFWELKWWEHSPQTQKDLRTAVAKAASGDFTRLEADVLSGSERVILDLSVRPVKDEANNVSMLILEARDITRHKLAEQASAERAARLKAILETAPDGIVTLTTNGQIESVNDAMDVIFGYKAEEIVGENIDLVMPGFFSEAEKEMSLDTLKVGERRIVGSGRETTGVRKDGSIVPVELSLSALRLGDHQILTGIVRDITERKEAQQRLKDFYSSVSHELRTPLTSIRTALSLIEEGVAGTITAETKPIIEIAQSEADRLIRLINDLLDIRKIEEGKFDLNLSEVDPKLLVEKALDSVRNIAKDSQVELVSEVIAASSLCCDEDRIIQVLTNLLSNAIKYSPPHERVSVSVQEGKEAYLFAVVDAGCGISEGQIHKLFGRFEQLQSNMRGQKHGSGLGLFISKAIVEHHGGLIGVDTSGEKGSRFWFELPAAHIG
jgi:PAS domain S-box-containing protein